MDGVHEITYFVWVPNWRNSLFSLFHPVYGKIYQASNGLVFLSGCFSIVRIGYLIVHASLLGGRLKQALSSRPAAIDAAKKIIVASIVCITPLFAPSSALAGSGKVFRRAPRRGGRRGGGGGGGRRGGGGRGQESEEEKTGGQGERQPQHCDSCGLGA